ncbi:MAG: N-succinylarginine dihydrolase [bacterium]
MHQQKIIEVNIDSLVGPSHFYSGLAYGNLAAMKHKGMLSSPKKAALEGLNKMKTIMDLGLPQLVMPPPERPCIETIRKLGFTGNEEHCLKKAYNTNKNLLLACSSASNMWMANSATVSPSTDTSNHKNYLSIANLSSQFHRSLETDFTHTLFKRVFHQTNMTILPPLPNPLTDEGAANHLRVSYEHQQQGINMFVYGRESLNYPRSAHEKYPFRQSLEASQAIARLHHLKPETLIFAQQHPEAVQKGAFHADVLMLSHRYVLICHEKSLKQQRQVLHELRSKVRQTCQIMPIIIEITEEELSLEEAIATYFFNSQLLSLPNNEWVLVVPRQCQENTKVLRLIQRILAGRNPIKNCIYVSVDQSMYNGGGPACLRLRMNLSMNEWNKVHQGVKLNNHLYHQLCQWICTHYRDILTEKDLISPKFIRECRDALSDLTGILKLDGIYSFK